MYLFVFCSGFISGVLVAVIIFLRDISSVMSEEKLR